VQTLQWRQSKLGEKMRSIQTLYSAAIRDPDYQATGKLFHHYGARLGCSERSALCRSLPEFAVTDHYGSVTGTVKNMEELIAGGYLPCKNFDDYLFGISESLGTLLETHTGRDALLCVAYVYLWSVLKSGRDIDEGYNQYAEYFLYRLLKCDYPDKKILTASAEYLRLLAGCAARGYLAGKETELSGRPSGRKYVLFTMAHLLLQFRQQGLVTAQMVSERENLRHIVHERKLTILASKSQYDPPY